MCEILAVCLKCCWLLVVCRRLVVRFGLVSVGSRVAALFLVRRMRFRESIICSAQVQLVILDLAELVALLGLELALTRL